jgi:hypothetical protein
MPIGGSTQHFRFLVPSEDEDVTLDWALDSLATAVVRDGSKIWCSIHGTRWTTCGMPGENATEYTGRAIKAFRRFCRKMGVHLMVVAHPTKMQQRHRRLDASADALLDQ